MSRGRGLSASLSRIAGLALAATLAAGGAGWAAAGEETAKVKPDGQAEALKPIRYGEGKTLCTLANQTITESSGLACSRRHADVFWTHNDSGGQPCLFAFDKQGQDLGVFRVAGAQAQDWEDMASFEHAKKPYLLVADTGDNARKRSDYTLYVVEEPDIPSLGRKGAKPPRPAKKPGESGKDVAKDKPAPALNTEPALAIRYRYEDGAHDAESMAIDPTTLTVLLLTKPRDTDPANTVYALPLPLGKKGGLAAKPAIATAKVVARFSWSNVPSGMDITPDGLRVVILAYSYAGQVVRQPGEEWKDTLSRPFDPITVPARVQGESICYGRDGRTLYLGSEKLPTPLIEVAPLAGE